MTFAHRLFIVTSLVLFMSISLLLIAKTSPLSAANKTSKDGVSSSMLHVSIQQIYLRGESGSCRMVIHVANIGTVPIATSFLIQTLNSQGDLVNVWNVPTGTIKPQDLIERTYSCTRTHFIKIDRKRAENWPHRCVVDRKIQTPCQADVKFKISLPEK